MHASIHSCVHGCLDYAQYVYTSLHAIITHNHRMAQKFYVELNFYDFAVAERAVKLKSINFYYYVAKILSCFDSVKFKIC